MAIAYCNLVGGQDELVFDGESLFVDASGTVRARGPQFREALVIVDVEEEWLGTGQVPDRSRRHGAGVARRRRPPAVSSRRCPPRRATWTSLDGEPLAEGIEELEATVLRRAGGRSGWTSRRPRPTARPRPDPRRRTAAIATRLGPEAEVYEALVLGLGDYCAKNRFRAVVLGLSGGIDSALTAAIAADALGPGAGHRRLHADPVQQRHVPRGRAGRSRANLGIRFHEIPIEALHRRVPGDPGAGARRTPTGGVTGENIQARIRGTLLMALSNARGLAPAHDRQQERAGGRLLHALRRHGRRFRGDQGRAEDARLPARPLPERAFAA